MKRSNENRSNRKRGTKSNYKKGNGQKPQVKDKNEGYEGKQSPTNDPKWYAQTPELLRDAASIPFSSAAGTSYSLNFYGDSVNPSTEQYVPGVLSMTIIPTIGGDSSFNSPLNIATNALYGQVRKANSGSANYDAPNLFMYCMSIAQIYSYINFLMRVYGVSQLYVHYNRYMPEALLNAMGVDYSSVQENLADFRYGINVLIHKASSFACPASITYFNRLAFLFAGIYSEGESVKDQVYMYNPAGFMKLTEQDTTPGWNLQYVPMPSPTAGRDFITVKQLLDYGTSLITPLLQSEDFNIISGDIIKAFGTNILGLQSLPEVYTILPVTDLAVLEQMQNANIIGFAWQYPNITCVAEVKEVPNTNTIRATVSLKGATLEGTSIEARLLKSLQARCNGNKLLTTILTAPTPEDVIERTRLMFTMNDESDESSYTMYIQTGSDICVGYDIWTIDPNTHKPKKIPQYIDFIMNSGTVYDDWVSLVVNHCLLENFKFHPMQYFWVSDASGNITFSNLAIDVDNYAIISPQTITNMNEAALLSLLNVPNVSKF